MLEFVNLFYDFVAGAFTAFNVPLFAGIGFCDIIIGFIVISLVVSVFWKGARA